MATDKPPNQIGKAACKDGYRACKNVHACRVCQKGAAPCDGAAPIQGCELCVEAGGSRVGSVKDHGLEALPFGAARFRGAAACAGCQFQALLPRRGQVLRSEY